MIKPANNRNGWIAALAAIAVVAIAHGLPTDFSSPLQTKLRNSLHAPAFVVFTIFLLFSLLPRFPAWKAVTFSAVLALGAGGLGELIQYFGYGEASFSDLTQDAIGIALGLCIGLTVYRRGITFRNPRITALLFVLALVGTITVVLPPANAVSVLAKQHRAVPHIAKFDDGWESKIYSTTRGATAVLQPAPAIWGADHGDAAYVTSSDTRYSGLEIHPARDWSAYKFLRFTAATADGHQHSVTVRIDDAGHTGKFDDRFQKKLLVTPQKQDFCIRISNLRTSPVGREMDVTRIRSIIFFFESPEGGEVIVLDDVHLAND